MILLRNLIMEIMMTKWNEYQSIIFIYKYKQLNVKHNIIKYDDKMPLRFSKSTPTSFGIFSVSPITFAHQTIRYEKKPIHRMEPVKVIIKYFLLDWKQWYQSEYNFKIFTYYYISLKVEKTNGYQENVPPILNITHHIPKEFLRSSPITYLYESFLLTILSSTD